MKDPKGPRQPLTEEELRAAMVGGAEPTSGSIALAEYDEAWPGQFRREEDRIRAALGSRALRVEHVGSTSVPGLAAKPVIDILVVVMDSADEAAYVPALETAGYVLRIREPDWNQHRLFKGPEVDVNLHVFSSGCPEIDRMLAFRDRLRTHPVDRERYERVKRSLAARSWKYVQRYADAKTEVVESILAEAERER